MTDRNQDPEGTPEEGVPQGDDAASVEGPDIETSLSDADTAFLNGDLDEEIYLQLPDGVLDKKDTVVRLLKGLYGLKQAARLWYQTLHARLVE